MSTSHYRPLFNPPVAAPPPAEGSPAAGPDLPILGDRSPQGRYVFSDEITLAVNVALATGRPLLVRGTSGSGKTSLARALAPLLGCGYHEAVVTGRTQARDLLWQTDLLRRLQDAQLNRLSADWRDYTVPGPLWWAFDPAGAQAQQARLAAPTAAAQAAAPRRMVLLIDEIDKADPDVPNSLLRPLGDLAFEVEETGQSVAASAPGPVVLITTNEERDLPPAFLRRCVELNMPPFDRDRLLAVGRAHHADADKDLLEAVAALVMDSLARRDRRDPNPAEFLDVLRACRELAIVPGSPAFRQLASVVLG